MSKDQYNPPEADIEKVLKQTNSDPRKLAIAYLRAQHRAKQQTVMAGVNHDVADMAVGVATGDIDRMMKAARRGKSRIEGYMEREKK